MIFYEAIDTLGQTHIVGTQADARAVNKDFEQIDIPVDKAGLRGFVQKLYDQIFDLSRPPADRDEPQVASAAVYEDYNGVNLSSTEAIQTVTTAEAESVQAPLSYAERSVEIDEIFVNLPIAHQLTLAAIALENARCRC